MTQEQLLNGFVWVVMCGFIVGVWAWQTLRPYFLFNDIRNGVVAPRAVVLFLIAPQAALFLILPVVIFAAWQIRCWWVVVILVGMFVSGCSALYFSIRIWYEFLRRKRESSRATGTEP